MARSLSRFALPFGTLALVAIASNAFAQDAPAKEDTTTDHSKVVGHVGVGYFGQFDIPLGLPVAGGDEGAPQAAQLVGIRTWLQDRVGLDVALGWGMRSGSVTTNGNSTDRPSTLTFALHGGVPISLFDAKHYTFFIKPELTYGHSGRTVKAAAGSPAGTPDSTFAGHDFEIGARAGAEIHFGFIGLPNLTLDATVGLHLGLTGGSQKIPTGAGGATTETSYTATTLNTISFHQPWNIFISNVAAIYYF
jgi:hypothetical protein